MRRLLTSLTFALSAVVASPPAVFAQDSEPVVIFAAASLKNALDAALADFTERTGQEVTVSYAASSTLAKQIEAAAPADIFFSADLDWMDYLAERNQIDPGSRVTLLSNEIVLIAPADSGAAVTIGPDFPLAEALGEGRLAMADTNSVPAGKYGKAALEALGVWDDVSARIAEAENVRAALLLVARGEAPLGIVYATDARAEPGVNVLGAFPADTHPPILYPVALTATAKAKARETLDFLTSGAARGHFEAQGFRFVAPGS